MNNLLVNEVLALVVAMGVAAGSANCFSLNKPRLGAAYAVLAAEAFAMSVCWFFTSGR